MIIQTSLERRFFRDFGINRVSRKVEIFDLQDARTKGIEFALCDSRHIVGAQDYQLRRVLDVFGQVFLKFKREKRET